jgi:hypothetical protein
MPWNGQDRYAGQERPELAVGSTRMPATNGPSGAVMPATSTTALSMGLRPRTWRMVPAALDTGPRGPRVCRPQRHIGGLGIEATGDSGHVAPVPDDVPGETMSTVWKAEEMDWVTAVWLGGAGGALVQVIALYVYVGSWHEARKECRDRRDAELPPLSRFVDFPADTAVAVTRLVLGAAAGVIFHGQIVGVAAAVAVGASAPAVLQQLGQVRGVREAVQVDGDLGRAAAGEPAA